MHDSRAMPFYSFAFVIMLASIAFYYKAGVDEIGSGIPWAGASTVIGAVVLLVFNGGVVFMLAAQLALLAAIAVYRVWREDD